MATSGSGPLDRGRSHELQRRNFAYSSLRTPRELSPHLSPDRITRHASPSPGDPIDDILPRVPQMYRTSFSAVTAPTRVSRAVSPLGLGEFARTPVRSTMPVRLHDTRRNPSLSPPTSRPSERQSRSANRTGWISVVPGTPGSFTVSTAGLSSLASSDGHLCSNEDLSTGCRTPNGELDRTCDITFSKVNGDPWIPVTTRRHISCSPIRHFSPSPIRTSPPAPVSPVLANQKPSPVTHQSPVDIPTPPSDHSLSPVPFSLDKPALSPDPFEEEKKVKNCITKEYVHVDNMGYVKAFRKKYPDADLERVLGKVEAMEMSVVNGDELLNLETSPKEQRKRSSTLPSENLIDKPLTNPPVKKSLSSSITNFFRKMSPKSLRKSSKSSNASKYTNSTFSSSNSINPSESGSIESSKSKNKSPKSSPLKVKKKPQSSTKVGTSGTPSPVQGEQSLRILRSIKDSSEAQQERSVYQTFKEKQSLATSEGVALKPQALRAVEFPDNLLEPSPPNESLPKIVMDGPSSPKHMQDTPPEITLAPTPRRPPIPKQRSHESQEGPRPPRTLNVREVAKLSRGMWQFPCMSFESIGQCSLDMYTTGRNTLYYLLVLNLLFPGTRGCNIESVL